MLSSILTALAVDVRLVMFDICKYIFFKIKIALRSLAAIQLTTAVVTFAEGTMATMAMVRLTRSA